MSRYPSEAEIERIKNWPGEDGVGLLEFVASIWAYEEYGWKRHGRRFWFHTLGWSGNEEIIDALQDNFIFWSLSWLWTRRGGHYCFKVPKIKKPSPSPTGSTEEKKA